MAQKLTVRSLKEQDYDNWNRLNIGSLSGSIYSMPEYLDCLCSAAGGGFKIIGVYKGEELLGGIALYERNSRYGDYIASRLLLYYNSPVIKNYQSRYPSIRVSREIAILTAIEKALSESGYAHIELHCRNIADVRPLTNNGWLARPAYTYVVPIKDVQATWSRIEQNLRRLIKRFEKGGGTLSSDDDFDSFYKFHHETHTRKGAPLYLPEKAYRKFFTRLKEQNLARLYHARLPDGESAASQLVLLGNHPVTHTVCAGAAGKHLKLGSTPFLRWKVFEDLSKSGYEANDLTSAYLNEVTRFKSQLGGDLVANFIVERTPSRAWRLQRRIPVLKRIPAWILKKL